MTAETSDSAEEDSQKPFSSLGQECSEEGGGAGPLNHSSRTGAHSSEHDSLEGEEGSTHLNGTAEGNFTITLAEMHVAHTQVGTLNEDWKVHLSCSTSCLLCFCSNTRIAAQMPFWANHKWGY